MQNTRNVVPAVLRAVTSDVQRSFISAIAKSLVEALVELMIQDSISNRPGAFLRC